MLGAALLGALFGVALLLGACSAGSAVGGGEGGGSALAVFCCACAGGASGVGVSFLSGGAEVVAGEVVVAVCCTPSTAGVPGWSVFQLLPDWESPPVVRSVLTAVVLTTHILVGLASKGFSAY